MASVILLLEDEPLILMDLEFAAQDLGCEVLLAATPQEAFEHIKTHGARLNVAVLDVSLGVDATCFEVAKRLDQIGVAFLLHSGDLDRHDERVRELDAELIAKPAAAEKVIATALAYAFGDHGGETRFAAE